MHSDTVALAHPMQQPGAALEAAIDYLERGLAVIPVPISSKAPSLPQWPQLVLGKAELPKYFSSPGNIGILLGKPSGGVVDVDLDHPVALQVAKHLLPETAMRHGRPSKPESHYWYRVTGELPSVKYAAPSGMLVELRSTGAQTVVPPSVHPTGEAYKWVSLESPATVTAEVLHRAVAKVAAATHLVEIYPEKGQRHQLSLDLAGALAHAGWPADSIIDFVKVVATVSADEECADRMAAAASTVEAYNAGKPVTGLPSLAKTIGDASVELMTRWLELAKDDQNAAIEKMVSELNGRHAIVPVGGNVCVLNEVIDPYTGYQRITLSRPADFRLRYCNRRLVTSGPGGKAEEADIGRIWLDHPRRRQHEALVFAPAGTDARNFNLYHGFAVQPKEGCCDRYLRHVRDVICSGSDKLFNYALRWMAHMVQYPGILPETAFILRGRQGTGKNTFVDYLGRLWGQHYIALTSLTQLVGRFNGHLSDALLVYANEALWGGNRQAEGTLKAMITDPFTSVEFKHKDLVTLPNFKRLIIASNEQWAAPVDLDDRRFLVLDIGDSHKEDLAYFQAIHQEMAQGGLPALLHTLQHLDLAGFDVRKLPVTPFGWDLKLKGMHSVPAFWYEELRDADPEGWDIETERQSLYRKYLEWCTQGHRFRAEIPAVFGKELKKLVPPLSEKRKQVPSPFSSERKWFYVFPGLKECRAGFEQLCKAGPEIWQL